MDAEIPRWRIREAVIGDTQGVSRLITDLGYPTDVASMRKRLKPILRDPAALTLVAESGGQVVGVAGVSLARYFEKDGIYARLIVLAVSSTTRGRGVGRRLVVAAERWSARKGAREMFVNSGLHRKEAHAFYRRCGYARTGFRFVRPLGRRKPTANARATKARGPR